MVTKVRWVVESVNGRIKQWKLLDKVLLNTLVPSIGDFVRITCAICNKYRPAITTQRDTDLHWTQEMLQRMKQPNRLLQQLEEKGLLRKRSTCTPTDATNLNNFPRLSMDELRNITMDVYQLKQAPSYVKEHTQKKTEVLNCSSIKNAIR